MATTGGGDVAMALDANRVEKIVSMMGSSQQEKEMSDRDTQLIRATLLSLCSLPMYPKLCQFLVIGNAAGAADSGTTHDGRGEVPASRRGGFQDGTLSFASGNARIATSRHLI
jgi:hypothetical protein